LITSISWPVTAPGVAQARLGGQVAHDRCDAIGVSGAGPAGLVVRVGELGGGYEEGAAPGAG
jgi:hypothetical protein